MSKIIQNTSKTEIKTPGDCADLGDIRNAIDALDEQIIQIMGQRMSFVRAASRFKPSESSIPAPDRVAQMLPQRREWAEVAGLNADFIEQLYSQIINWYISEQIDYWRQQRGLA
ncbi:isochorismate pyruvate lyase [Pseudomonas sp. BT76 TE3572]|uniref:chorismate mutase n=1 Tax=Pseudomonas mandelii PD30 TaxID=1419583 RepID=A0A059L5I1_9PSED|nr:isochorismate-pyruvate lyase [Pseudomonas mandelii PD30]